MKAGQAEDLAPSSTIVYVFSEETYLRAVAPKRKLPQFSLNLRRIYPKKVFRARLKSMIPQTRGYTPLRITRPIPLKSKRTLTEKYKPSNHNTQPLLKKQRLLNKFSLSSELLVPLRRSQKQSTPSLS